MFACMIQVLTAAVIFWDVMLCGLLKVNRCSEAPFSSKISADFQNTTRWQSSKQNVFFFRLLGLLLDLEDEVCSPKLEVNLHETMKSHSSEDSILYSHCLENIKSLDITADYTFTFEHNRSKADETFCICRIQHKQMGVQWDSTSAIYRLLEAIIHSGQKHYTTFPLYFTYPRNQLR